MARSRATRNEMRGHVEHPSSMPRKSHMSGGILQEHARGEEVHWMQDVHPKKGALHAQLHIPEGKKIPTKRLEKASHAESPLLRKRANLALRYRGE